MEQNVRCNTINTLYYLYFWKRELVYHFEIIWSEDGMSSRDEEYSYIFCGLGNQTFQVDLETYYFLIENKIIEEDSGSENESVFILTDYYRAIISTFLKKNKKGG